MFKTVVSQPRIRIDNRKYKRPNGSILNLPSKQRTAKEMWAYNYVKLKYFLKP